MSKRYGRNQKRKALDLLEQERALRGYAETRTRDIENATDEIRRRWGDIVQLLKNTVGPSCLIRAIASDVTNYSVNLPEGDPLRLASLSSPEWSRYENSSALTQMNNIDLYPLLMGEYRDRLTGQHVVRLRYGHGTHCYAISENALRNVPFKWLAERVANELVEHLTRAVR